VPRSLLVPHSFSVGGGGGVLFFSCMHYVYVLRLSDDSIYIGLAASLQKRLTDHKHGLVSSTKNLRPVDVVWFCAFPNKKLAADFEKYLKSGAGFSWRMRHLGF